MPKLRAFARWSVVVGLVMAIGVLPLGQGWNADAQEAPESEGAGSLRAMLQRAPDILGQPGAPTAHVAMYANVAARLAAVGVEAPDADDDEGVSQWAQATTDLLLLTAGGAQRGLDPEWRETFGFDIFQVDQSLELGEPPSVTTFLRGRFDEAELRAAWERSGYRAIDVDGVTVMSVGPGGELAMDTPVGRLALSRLNNAVILDDGTLVFASTLADIRAVLEVDAGQASALADRAEIAELVDSLEVELASALLVPGTALQREAFDPADLVRDGTPVPSIDALATRIAGDIATAEAELGQMPPVIAALFGVTVEGTLPDLDPAGTVPEDEPAGRALIALHMGHQNAAEAAVRVVSGRLATQQSAMSLRPWAEMFPEREVSVASGAPVVLVDLGTPAGERLRVVFSLVFARDVGFVAW